MSDPIAVAVDNDDGETVTILPNLGQVADLFAPAAALSGAVPFTLRDLHPGEAINDASDSIGPGWDVELDERRRTEGPLTLGGEVRPIGGIDAGLAKLGYPPDGVVAAVRAAIVMQNPTMRHIYLARPGLIHLHQGNKLAILHDIGRHFGDPEHYVRVEQGVPVAEKGILKTAQQTVDRVRNFVERSLQSTAAGLVTNGIVVWDGAATPDSWDTPPGLIERLAAQLTGGGNHLIALSKRTTLTVSGHELRSVLDGTPIGPRFLYLNELLRQDRIRRIETGGRADRRVPIGHLYAARFGATGETYRVDVVPAKGYTPLEALESFYASTLFRAGYPDVLVRAHLHSYFSYPDLIRLQAAVPKAFGLIPRRDIDHGAAFAPFGGRWK